MTNAICVEPAVDVRLDVRVATGAELAAEPGQAQSRKATANEIAAIRDCAARNKDDLDEGERKCLFNLVAERCLKKGPANNVAEADCYRIEEFDLGRIAQRKL